MNRTIRILLTMAIAFSAMAAGATVSSPVDVGDFPLMQAVWDQYQPVVAASDGSYLVAYLHREPELSLRVTRVSSDGEVLDPFGIELGKTQSSFDTIWTGREYLIAWTRSSCAEDTGSRCLQLTTVSPDGEVDHVLQLPAVDDPRIAVRGDSLLISWSENIGESVRLRSHLLNLNGQTVSANIDLLAIERYTQVEQVVATDDGFLVFAAVPSGTGPTETLIAIPVSPQGVVGDVSTLAEDDSIYFQSIATNGERTAVVFGPRSGWPSLVILDSTGDVLVGPAQLQVGETPLIVSRGDLFALVSKFRDVVAIQTLDSEGTLGPLWPLEGELAPDAQLSALTAGMEGYLLIWQEQKGDGFWEPGGFNQYVTTYDHALQPLTLAAPLMLSAPVQRRSALTAADQSYLHVWEEYRDGVWQIYSQPMGPDGRITVWPVDHAHGEFSVASSGEDYLLAVGRLRWTEAEGFERFVELTRIAIDGSVELRKEFPEAVLPELVFDGKQYVLLWRTHPIPGSTMLTVLSDDLTPRGEAVAIDDFEEAAGFAGRVILLETVEGDPLFPDTLPTQGLGFRLVETANTVVVRPLNTIFEPTTDPLRNLIDATVGTNGEQAMIVWQEGNNDFDGGRGSRTATALVDSSGAVVSQRFGGLSRSLDSATDSMTWNGSRFVSAGMDQQGDLLLVQYFNPFGAPSQRLEIPVHSYGNGEVSIASTGGGQIFVDYSAFQTNDIVGAGVERVLMRSIITESGRRERPLRR